MHEQTIAKQIIEKAKSYGYVSRIVVEVGDLGHLPANEMRDVLVGMVDWDVVVEEKRGKVKCICGYEGEPHIIEKKHGGALFDCPKCGGLPRVIDGGEIILKQVEVN
ncbi:hypothetical protein HOK51_09985 [Candidatus Woesearchaeota archaeon]|jgi:Zn finger protein HypA/HybF involved in hydrogenase expression|nr:hypothetical protein [Candidatus Woesearchaeota archaeon]MBT6520153.1 hypothetical protein [Candidatus Woesearchaeota archaeon]MBT7366758.1 hypothetical protein [Candidatus Woesearchaeota archaeon]